MNLQNTTTILLTLISLFFLNACHDNSSGYNENRKRLAEYEVSNKIEDESNINQDSAWVIDLEELEKPTLPVASEIFQEREYIILETPEDEIIGEISKILTVGNRLIILDARISKKVYLFDNEGNFIHVVGHVGNGPGEYLDPKDVNYRNGLIFVTDRQFTVHAFGLDNEFMAKFNLPFYSSSGYVFKNGHFAFSNNSIGEPEVNYHLILIENKKITQRLFNNRYKSIAAFTSSPISSNRLFHRNSFLYFKPFDNEIYEVSQSSIDLKFRFNSNDLITNEVLEDSNNFYEKSFDYSWIYQYPILETDSMVQIRAHHRGLITMLLNKYDSTISIYSGMKDDLLLGGIEDFPMHAQGNYFYTPLNVERLYQIKKEFENQREKGNSSELVANFKKKKPELYQILENVEEISNPILLKSRIR